MGEAGGEEVGRGEGEGGGVIGVGALGVGLGICVDSLGARGKEIRDR